MAHTKTMAPRAVVSPASISHMYMVSSTVSVPWVTTTPSTSPLWSSPRARRATVVMRSGSMSNPDTFSSDSVLIEAMSSRPGTEATSSSGVKPGTSRPPVPGRQAMVPPVASTATRGKAGGEPVIGP